MAQSSVTAPVFRRLMRELGELTTSPPEGIRVVTAEDNMLDVTGIIEGPQGTPYAGGYFRVKFRFTDEFPAAPPKCWFATKVFHPNVGANGEICVSTLKKDWKSSYGIGHILVTVKCLLIYPNPESALDEEAGRLLLENYESYCDRAKLITSVHATPRVRPTEFDTPSAPAATTETAAAPATAPIPIESSSKTSPTPLQTSPSNLRPVPVSRAVPVGVKEKEKTRHVSPSPLATADANVAGKAQPGGGVAPAAAMSDKAPATAATKSGVKRAAGTGATGADKRKKALKRL